MKPYEKPIPRITGATKEFWEGCKQRKLLIPRCGHCGAFHFPPLHLCRACSSRELKWTQVSGKGTIYSYIVPYSSGDEPAPRGFSKEYPYVVALVELAGTGGVRIASNVVNCPPEEIRIGMPVDIVFEDVTDEITLPKFKVST